MSTDSALGRRVPAPRAMLAPHHSRTGSSRGTAGTTVEASAVDEAAAQPFSRVSA
ncbi:hypothetical protein [Streptomyces hirsutus]|uniref:hypothetical protein n=1 Tax=Streptomyces hirsutus TaxID=35620 RepID=UPI000AFA7979|nr:hypothetical protein [Streptomyces hirsutus]